MKTIFRIATAFVFLSTMANCSRALGTDTVTVIGTITDPNGVPYAGGTIDATLIPTGTTPTVPKLNGQTCGIGGCQITGYIQPVSINRDGTFALVVYCNTGCSAPISPSGTQWLFTVRNPGAPAPVGYGGISFTVTETINVNGSQDIGADLRAAAPQLLVSAAAGSGPVTGTGTTGFIPAWTSSTALGNSTCDDGVTTALTVTCTHSIATSGNVSLTGGTVFTSTVESSTGQGGDLDVFCDSTSPCHLNLGSNVANEAVTIAGGTIAMNTSSGATLSGFGSPVAGGVQGAGTLNAEGLFVNGNPVVQLANAVNVTPVTANANTTGFQNLQQATYSNPGAANSVGKTYRVHAGGTFAVATGGGAVKAQIALNMNTVQALNLSAFAPATTGTYSWSVDFVCTTKLSGALGRLLCAGHENFGGVAAGSQLDNATYPFFATINTDLTTDTGPLLQAQFSTGSTSNTMTSDYMSLEFLN